MSHVYRAGQRFTIVKIELLVPDGQEGFLDLLSDFRDDNPDQLVEFAVAGRVELRVTAERAAQAWQALHGESLKIVIEDPDV